MINNMLNVMNVLKTLWKSVCLSNLEREALLRQRLKKTFQQGRKERGPRGILGQLC